VSLTFGDWIWQQAIFHWWWLLPSVLGLAAAIAVMVAVAVFGWDRVRPYIVPIIVAVASLGLLSRARSQGYREREEVEERAKDKAERIGEDQKDKAEDLTDDQLDNETDRWTRHELAAGGLRDLTSAHRAAVQCRPGAPRQGRQHPPDALGKGADRRPQQNWGNPLPVEAARPVGTVI
jgi:hypothetical protein